MAAQLSILLLKHNGLSGLLFLVLYLTLCAAFPYVCRTQTRCVTGECYAGKGMRRYCNSEVNTLRTYLRIISAPFRRRAGHTSTGRKAVVMANSASKSMLIEITAVVYSYKHCCSGEANSLVAFYFGLSQRHPRAGRWIATSCEMDAQVDQEANAMLVFIAFFHFKVVH